jgi:P27 family predicted phage terminase small subunit
MARGRKPKVIDSPFSIYDDSHSGGVAHMPAAGEVLAAPEGCEGEAKLKWERLAPVVHAAVGLTVRNADAFKRYCQSDAIRDQAIRELQGKPLIVTSPNGTLYSNPYLKVINMLDGQLSKLAERFGLDPLSGRRMNLPSEKAKGVASEMGKLLEGDADGDEPEGDELGGDTTEEDSE